MSEFERDELSDEAIAPFVTEDDYRDRCPHCKRVGFPTVERDRLALTRLREMSKGAQAWRMCEFGTVLRLVDVIPGITDKRIFRDPVSAILDEPGGDEEYPVVAPTEDEP